MTITAHLEPETASRQPFFALKNLPLPRGYWLWVSLMLLTVVFVLVFTASTLPDVGLTGLV